MALYQRRSPVDPHLFPSHKRQKRHRGSNEPPERDFANEPFHHDDLALPVDDILANHELFSVNDFLGHHGSPVVTIASTAWNHTPAATDPHLPHFDQALANGGLEGELTPILRFK
jgi:hypothetical protein